MITVTTKLDLSRIKGVSKALPRELGKAVRATTLFLERRAKEKITDMQAIDTGTLKNSVHALTHGASGREAAIASMEKSWPGPGAKGTTHDLETEPVPIDRPADAPTDPYHGVVAVAAEYGRYVHDGTARMSARPFLTEAGNDTQPELAKAVEAAIKRAVGQP